MLTAVFAVCPSPTHAARPVSGVVTDSESGQPVAHAVVTITETGTATLADNAGRFEFGALPDGTYHLCARRIGYQPRCGVAVHVDAEERSAVAITLAPDPLEFAAMHVRGRRRAGKRWTDVAQEVVTADQIDRTGATTAAEALERSSSVEVIRNSSGTATVSIRGGSPDGVAVIVDGTQINAGQAVDVGSIPAESIESIAILEGPAAAGVGIDALAGAIVIVTKAASEQTAVHAGFGYGSFDRQSTRIGIDGIGFADQRLRVSWQNEQIAGDFGYHDTLGNEFTRENNAAHRQHFAAQGHGGIGGGWRWQSGVSYFRLRAGIPGALSQLTPLASRRERRYVYAAGVSNRHRRGDFELSYSRTRDWNEYRNAGAPAYATEYRSRAHQWRARYAVDAGWLNGALAAIEYAGEDLQGTDHLLPQWSFGTADRRNYGAALRYSREFAVRTGVLSAIRVTSAYRYDQTETVAAYPTSILSPPIDPPQKVWRFGSPHMGIATRGTVEGIDWSISAAYGKSFRRAPLLDMFWVESYRTRGNPGLRPERSEQSEIGYSLRTKRFVTVEFGQRYFWSRYDDLIYWQPGQGGVWSPANIGRAQIDGLEDQLSLAAVGNVLSLEITHQDHDHVNRAGEPNTDGQPLPLRYRHRTQITLRGDAGWGYAEIARRRYGRRTLRAAGTKWLEPFSVVDIATVMRMSRFGASGEIGLRIENVGDTDYELIEREPMPGRSYRLNIGIEL